MRSENSFGAGCLSERTLHNVRGHTRHTDYEIVAAAANAAHDVGFIADGARSGKRRDGGIFIIPLAIVDVLVVDGDDRVVRRVARGDGICGNSRAKGRLLMVDDEGARSGRNDGCLGGLGPGCVTELGIRKSLVRKHLSDGLEGGMLCLSQLELSFAFQLSHTQLKLELTKGSRRVLRRWYDTCHSRVDGGRGNGLQKGRNGGNGLQKGRNGGLSVEGREGLFLRGEAAVVGIGTQHLGQPGLVQLNSGGITPSAVIGGSVRRMLRTHELVLRLVIFLAV